MSLKVSGGSIFLENARHMVIPTNARGIFGAGLARQFAIRYPEAEKCYKVRISFGNVKETGDYLFVTLQETPRLRGAVLFATKDEPSDKSDMARIFNGLVRLEKSDLLRDPRDRKSFAYDLAIPAIGCGLGAYDEEDGKMRKEALEGALGEIFGDSEVRVIYLKTHERPRSEERLA